MELLIFGCGVIGSIYAIQFANAGYDVSVYARGERLKELQNKGLLYKDDRFVKKASVKIISSISNTYDYVFLTVKNEQIIDALLEFKDNKSHTLVTMVNNPSGYDEWEKIVGNGRILPAFPGAGGWIEDGILYAGLTPQAIQLTTYGEINGKKTKRLRKLDEIMKKSRIPSEICDNMYHWQMTHLALVVPLADAIYLDGGDNYSAGRNKAIMKKTAYVIKRNFRMLEQKKIQILPIKFKVIMWAPESVLALVLKHVYQSDFGKQFIYKHAYKAKKEMLTLRKEYYKWLRME